jgi:hypothetical protein
MSEAAVALEHLLTLHDQEFGSLNQTPDDVLQAGNQQRRKLAQAEGEQ